jgi:ABC-type branched-subunit amino acid transport system substrate-binding protein
MKKSLITMALLGVGMGGTPWAHAQDAYVVGLTGALTGPVADTYAPVIESLKTYVEQLNARGGVNGKPVKLLIEDNRGEPSKAAADAKKFLTQDGVVMVIDSSTSSTYAPVVAETKRARVPLYYAGAVCPKEVFPPADELQFCSTAFAAQYDSQMTLAFIKENSKEPVKLGLVAMAIPVSRGEIDYAEGLSKTLGMTPVEKLIVPPPTPDYTPFATKIKEAGANWVYSWAPWVTEIKTLEGLRKLGWNGRYIAWAHIQAEEELTRVKDSNFYVVGANALFQDNLPVHNEIREAAKKANLGYPVEQLAEGWVSGMVLEQTLRATAWPPTPGKVLAAMSSLQVDTKGLRGGPIEWTKTNHFRTRQNYRVWHWDTAKQSVVRVKDWTGYDVK